MSSSDQLQQARRRTVQFQENASTSWPLACRKRAQSTPQIWSLTRTDDHLRAAFEVLPGQKMEYEVFLPPEHDPSMPIPFIVSVSGTGQTHVNGFSRRLISADWAVAVPLKPEGAPLFFDGCGAPGDGPWYLRQFCHHLSSCYHVRNDKFLMAGVSNGGSSVLKFASLWPELCCGVVAVTGALKATREELAKLRGLPIDMYVGSNDECGFYEPMVDLDAQLRSVSQLPPAQLTVFEGAGHVCSPLVDGCLIHGKMRLMLLRSLGRASDSVKLSAASLGGWRQLPAADLQRRLQSYAQALDLRTEVACDGGLVACVKADILQQQLAQGAHSFAPPIQPRQNSRQHAHTPTPRRSSPSPARAQAVAATSQRSAALPKQNRPSSPRLAHTWPRVQARTQGSSSLLPPLLPGPPAFAANGGSCRTPARSSAPSVCAWAAPGGGGSSGSDSSPASASRKPSCGPRVVAPSSTPRVPMKPADMHRSMEVPVCRAEPSPQPPQQRSLTLSHRQIAASASSSRVPCTPREGRMARRNTVPAVVPPPQPQQSTGSPRGHMARMLSTPHHPFGFVPGGVMVC